MKNEPLHLIRLKKELKNEFNRIKRKMNKKINPHHKSNSPKCVLEQFDTE